MRLYLEAGGNGERLMSYYPRFYRGVDEMEAILAYFGGLCDDMEARNERAYLNNFILEADEPTIARWEDFLGIEYDRPLTLDQRRRVVLGRISGSGHIGEPEIRELVGAYTDCGLTVDFALGVIYVDIDGEIFDEGNLYRTLLQRIPAHLALRMTARTIREFPMELRVGFGGAVGQEIQARPEDEPAVSRQDLSLSLGAFSMPWLGSGPRSAGVSSLSGLPASFAGGTQSLGLGEPVGDGGQYAQDGTVSMGAYGMSSQQGHDAGKDRLSSGKVRARISGAYGSEPEASPVGKDRDGKGASKRNGGYYCRTHITAKRIKDKEE